MMASVPSTMALGSVRSGSFTSPLTLARSPQPSKAQSTLTRARPKADTVKLPGGIAGVKLPPVLGRPSASARMTMITSPPYLAMVVTFCTSEPQRSPTTLMVAMRMRAPAAR